MRAFVCATLFYAARLGLKSNNIVQYTMPQMSKEQELVLSAVEKEAEKLAAKGARFFDLNKEKVNFVDFEL